MRPQSFHQQRPPGRPFNQFQGPRGGFGARPPQFPQPGMIPPPGRGPIPGPGPGIGAGGGSPKLQSFMDTANRFLATAQSFQPLVQQATPMFRNLPALWRLYKGFQGLPKTSEGQEHGQREQFDFDESMEESPERFNRPERPVSEERPARPTRQRPPMPEKFARPQSTGRRNRYEDYDLSESPAYNKPVKPKKASTKPSIPRIFQPPYHFDE